MRQNVKFVLISSTDDKRMQNDQPERCAPPDRHFYLRVSRRTICSCARNTASQTVVLRHTDVLRVYGTRSANRGLGLDLRSRTRRNAMTVATSATMNLPEKSISWLQDLIQINLDS